jgi:hypothetical protein
MFRLTEKEINQLQTQNASANISRKSRHYPRVFTEQGLLMLANVLNSEIADKIRIKIYSYDSKTTPYFL